MDPIDCFDICKMENEFQLIDSYFSNRFKNVNILHIFNGTYENMWEGYYWSGMLYQYKHFKQFRRYRDLLMKKIIDADTKMADVDK